MLFVEVVVLELDVVDPEEPVDVLPEDVPVEVVPVVVVLVVVVPDVLLLEEVFDEVELLETTAGVTGAGRRLASN